MGRDPAVTEATESESTADVDDARRQIGDVLKSWSHAVLGRPSSAALNSDRLLSFAIAIAPDFNPLPTHLANRLYRQRESLHLSAVEAESWLRAVCEEAGRVPDGVWGRYVPGWFFFAHDDDLPRRLLQFAQEDAGLRARGAVLLLTAFRARPLPLWSSVEMTPAAVAITAAADAASPRTPVECWVALLDSGSTGSEALQYLHDVATPKDQPLLAQIAAAAEHQPWAVAVKAVSASISGDRLPSLDYLLVNPYNAPAWLEADVLSALPDADTDRLIDVIHGRNTNDSSRIRAFEELLARGALDDTTGPAAIALMLRRSDATRAHLLDRHYNTVDEGLRAWLRQGWSSLGEDDRELGVQERVEALIRSPEELSAAATPNLSGLDAWRALSVQGAEHLVARARDVLLSGGCEFGDGLGDDSGPRMQGLRTFVAAQGRAAALRVLASAPAQAREPGDFALVRAEVATDHFATQQAGLEALATLAEVDDVPALLEAVPTALRRHPTAALLQKVVDLGGAEAARPLLGADQDEVAAAGARALAQDPTVGDDELVEMLYNDKGPVRRAALDGLTARLDAAGLTVLLDRYAARPGPHYYDVITALDWVLYAETTSDR